jgi:hypothetical protein
MSSLSCIEENHDFEDLGWIFSSDLDSPKGQEGRQVTGDEFAAEVAEGERSRSRLRAFLTQPNRRCEICLGPISESRLFHFECEVDPRDYLD